MHKKDIENPILMLLNELRDQKGISWAKVGKGLMAGEMAGDMATGKTEASLSLMELLIQRLILFLK
jgi:hypothetical protein